MLVCHITACAWYGVGLLSKQSSTPSDLTDEANRVFSNWIEKNGLDDPSVTNEERYIAALYSTMATLTTVGYGDIVAVSSMERAFGTVMLVGGTGVFAMIVSSIAATFKLST